MDYKNSALNSDWRKMARLPALIDDLAAHDARGRATVELVARLVREAGLIRTTKRGRGAAEMTASDCAALLLGLCVMEAPKDAATAVKQFSELVADSQYNGDWIHLEPEAQPLEKIASNETLGGTLKSIIEGAEELNKLKYRSIFYRTPKDKFVWNQNGQPEPVVSGGFIFKVRLYQQAVKAEVLIQWEADYIENADKLVMGRQFYRTFIPADLCEVPKNKSQEIALDRSSEVNLRFETFLRLNRLIKGEETSLAG